MKYKLKILILFSHVIINILLNNNLYCQITKANFNFYQFENNSKQKYLEYYLSFNSNNLNFVLNDSSIYQAFVNVNIKIKNSNTEIYSDEYTFVTPKNKTIPLKNIFIEKKKIFINNGDYIMDIMIKDENSNSNEVISNHNFKIIDYEKNIYISDIILIEKYNIDESNSKLNKNGVNIIPIFYEKNVFINDYIKQLYFYFEWYNLRNNINESENYMISYHIEDSQYNKILNQFFILKRKKISDNNILFSGFNIENLRSGNYNFVARILDSLGTELCRKKVFFQRKNSKKNNLSFYDSKNNFYAEINNIELMAEYISSVYPIFDEIEVMYAENQLKNWNLEQMKDFLYNFWKTKNPLKPKLEWDKYQKKVSFVNSQFSYRNIKGFATSQGKVYLKYGEPNSIEKYPQTSNHKRYQIWNYNKIKNQTNQIFIFIENINDYDNFNLIHSTVSGEINNINWQKSILR